MRWLPVQNVDGRRRLNVRGHLDGRERGRLNGDVGV